MSAAKWKKAKIWVAYASGPDQRNGYEYLGLALFRQGGGWSLTHIGTGLRVQYLDLPLSEARAKGAAFAECANWDWSGPDGYKNVEPDLLNKISKVREALGFAGNQNNATSEASRAMAQEVARLRV